VVLQDPDQPDAKPRMVDYPINLSECGPMVLDAYVASLFCARA